MKKIMFHMLFLSTSVYSMDSAQVEPIHIVYSHAWYENNKREICSVGGNIVTVTPALNEETSISEISEVMTFRHKRIATTKNDKQFSVGDDGTTFINSYAMKFAFLGDSLSMPSYPDASLSPKESLSKAVLYTKPAVIALANHLYDRVITEKRSRIALVGPCVGASIAINCLKALASFSDNEDYFAKTKIKNVSEAKAIIDAINKGYFIAMVPLMRLEHHNAVAMPSALLSALTIGALTLAAYSKGGSQLVSQNSEVARLSFMSIGLLAYCVLSSFTKNAYAKIIRHCIVPLLSGKKYDSQHEDPIDDIEILKNKITCPVFLNFTEKDGVMQWKNDDLIQLFKAFNGDDTYLYVTEDTGHMQLSPVFLQYLSKHHRLYDDQCADVSMASMKCQYTEDEVKKMVYPWGFVSKIWATNKWAIGIVMLCMIPVILKLAQAGNFGLCAN